MFRRILGGIAGIITMVAVVMLTQLGSHKMFPPPADLDFSDEAAVAVWMSELPLGAYFMILLSYFAGAFFGAFTGGWIAGGSGRLFAIIVGVAVILGATTTVLSIPHPIWFTVVALAGIPLAAYAGGRLAPKRKYG